MLHPRVRVFHRLLFLIYLNNFEFGYAQALSERPQRLLLRRVRKTAQINMELYQIRMAGILIILSMPRLTVQII